MIRYHNEMLPLWNQSLPMMILPPQPTPLEIIDDLPRNTEMPTAEVTLPDQYDGGVDQHLHGREDQPRDVPVVETTPVSDQETRPVRQRIPNTRYPANEDPREGGMIVYTLWRRVTILGASADANYYQYYLCLVKLSTCRRGRGDN